MIGWFAGAPATNFAIERSAPTEIPLPSTPPPDAVVLLAKDGPHRFVSMAGNEINWPMEKGALISSGGDGRKSFNQIVSQYHFRDAQIHVEFMLPAEGAGNSGIYLHGHCELQILKAGGGAAELDLPTDQEFGAIDKFSPP